MPTSTLLTRFRNFITGKKLRPLLLLAVLFIGTRSIAQNSFNVSSGVWNSAANWSAGHVPTSAEDVIIPTGKTVTATALAITVNSITVQNGGSLTTSGAQNITVTNALTVGNAGTGTATVAFGGTGTISLGSVSMPDNAGGTAGISQTGASGAINITNNMNIGNGATYTIAKATASSWGGVQVNNGGSLVYAGTNNKTITIGTGNILVNAGGSFATNNTATAILTVTNNGAYTNYGTFTGIATSPGTGTITLTTTGAALLKASSTNNFNIFTCSGGLTQEAGAGFTSGGLVTLSGGTSTIVSTGAGALNALTVSGASTSVIINGGTSTVTGTLTVTSTSTVQVTGASTILNANAVTFATTTGGILQVSGGTTNVTTTILATTAGIAGNIKVDGGTLNVNSTTANQNAISLTATGSSLYISGQGVVNVLGGLTTSTSTSTTNVNLGSGTAITVPFTIKDSSFAAGSAKLNISGKFIMAGNGAYNQTGGLVLAGTTSANANATAAMFGTAANNSFTMSGGVITILNKNTIASGLDLNIASTTTAFSNGVTTFLGNGATATGATGSWNIQGNTPNLTYDNAAANNLGINFSAALNINGDLNFSGTGTITSANNTTTLKGMSAANPGNLTVTGQGHISLTTGTFAFGSASGNQIYNSSNTTIGDTVSAVTLNNTYNTTGGQILLNKPLAINGTITYTKGYFQTTTNSIVAQLGTQASSLPPVNANGVSYTDSVMRRYYIANRTSSGLATAANKNANRFSLAKNGNALPLYIDANVTATTATPVFIDAKISYDANAAPAWQSTIIQNHYTKLNRDFKLTYSGSGTLNSFNIGIDTGAVNFTAPPAINTISPVYYLLADRDGNGTYNDAADTLMPMSIAATTNTPFVAASPGIIPSGSNLAIAIWGGVYAGTDTSSCLNSGISLTGTPSGGTWTGLSTNPAGGATVGSTSGGTALVTFAFATGMYSFIYSNGISSDTMNILVTQCPGGVPGVTAWFKADYGTTMSGSNVTQWQEASGNPAFVGNNPVAPATAAQPSILPAQNMNYNPVLTFNSGQNYLQTPSMINTANLRGPYTASFATITNQISGSVLFHVSSTVSKTTMEIVNSFILGPSLVNTTNIGATGPAIAFAERQATAVTTTFTDSSFLNGVPNNQANRTGISSPPASGSDYFVIGGLPSSAGNSWAPSWTIAGDFPECILYNRGISSLERSRITSYFAVKYGISLSQSTLTNYTNSASAVIWNATTNSGYPNDIAGIMRDDVSSLNQKQSQSINTGSILSIAVGSHAATNLANTNTFTNNLSSLVWSSNGAANNTDQTTSMPLISCAVKRLSREWIVQAVNMGDKVQVKIDLSAYAANNGGSLPSANASDYVLMIDDNAASFISTDIMRGVPGSSINANVITFNNVNLTSSSTGSAVFTLAFGNIPSPALGASTTSSICGNFGNYQPNYFKDGTTGNAVAAINPNGNSGQVYSVTESDNATALASQPASKTTNGTNTTGLMARMYTFSNTGTAITGGVTVRIYYATQDSLDARARTDQSLTASSSETGRWFKLEGSAADVIADQTPTGFSGAHTYTALTPSAYGTEGGVRYVEFSGITNFSTFGFMSSNLLNLLPVGLTNFTAAAGSNKTVNLGWQTNSESNTANFVVERSSNSSSWETAATVKAAGYSNVPLQYAVTDKNPYTGVSYYRLKQTDLDGKYVYSAVRSVRLDANGKAIVIYPDPATKELTITASDAELKTLRIFNMTGQDMNGTIKVISKDNNRVVLDVSALEPGIYNVKTASTISKIVKQ